MRVTFRRISPHPGVCRPPWEDFSIGEGGIGERVGGRFSTVCMATTVGGGEQPIAWSAAESVVRHELYLHRRISGSITVAGKAVTLVSRRTMLRMLYIYPTDYSFFVFLTHFFSLFGQFSSFVHSVFHLFHSPHFGYSLPLSEIGMRHWCVHSSVEIRRNGFIFGLTRGRAHFMPLVWFASCFLFLVCFFRSCNVLK